MHGRFWTLNTRREQADARSGRGWGRPALPMLLCAALLLGVVACGSGAPTATPAPVPPPTTSATVAPTATAPVIATASRATATSTHVASPVASATRGIVNYPAVVRLAI